MNITEAFFSNETLVTTRAPVTVSPEIARNRIIRRYVWWSTYGIIYFSCMLFTLLSTIFLVAVPKCFPRTMRLWLIPMSLMDLVGIGFNGVPLLFSRSYPPQYFLHPGLARCRTADVVSSCSEDLAGFFLLGLSIERVIFVLKPLRASSIITPLRVKIALAVMTIFDLIMHITWAVLIYTGVNPKTQYCTYDRDVYQYRPLVRLGAVRLSFFIISIGSSIVLFKAVVSSARMRAKMSKGDESAANLKREMRLGLMLLLMNVSFLIFTIPREVMLAVNEVFIKKKIYMLGLSRTGFFFSYGAAMMNVRVCNAINWIFYCGVSSKFWAWYRGIFCPCWKPAPKQQRASTMVSTSVSSG